VRLPDGKSNVIDAKAPLTAYLRPPARRRLRLAQEALARNAQEVADLGKQLYERIVNLAEHWPDVGSRLDKAVEAYNRSVATLESRVLVSARTLHDLKAGPQDVEIEGREPVERTVRRLEAPEMVPLPAAEEGA
jgi:DNA recombination protein RmuC